MTTAIIDNSRFLPWWFEGKEFDDHILIWTKGNKRSTWFLSPEQAYRFAAKQNDDTYFGLCLRDRDHGTGKRGGTPDCICVPGVWIDIDIQGQSAHQKVDLCESMDEAMRFLETLELPPSAIISTGGGVHAYWKYSKPERCEVMSTEQGWLNETSQLWNAAIAERAEFNLDMTFDLARIFRVPGTRNYKIPESPLPCQIVKLNEYALYPEKSIRAWAEKYGVIKKVSKPEIKTKTELTFADTADGLPSISASRLEEFFNIEPKARAAFEHRGTKYASDSEVDYALASFAFHAGWSDGEVFSLLMEHRRSRNSLNKKSHDYFVRTIENIKASMYDTIQRARAIYSEAGDLAAEYAAAGQAVAEVIEAPEPEPEANPEPVPDDYEGLNVFQAGDVKGGVELISDVVTVEKAKEPEPLPQRTQQMLENLSDIFGFEVTRIVRIVTENPQFRLESGDKRVPLGDGGNIISQNAFRKLIYSHLLRVLPKYSTNDWETIIKKIGMATVDEVAAEAESVPKMVSIWLENYLYSKKMLIMTDELRSQIMSSCSPFFEETYVHIFAQDFFQWARAHCDNRVTRQQLSIWLTELGAQTQIWQNVVLSGGHRSNRTTYILPKTLTEKWEMWQ